MTTCEETYAVIQRMIEAGQHDQAMTALEAFVAEWTDRPAAHYDLGNLYYNAGQPQKALLHYETAASLDPSNPVYLKSQADLLFSENNAVENALALYEKSLSIDPEDVQTLMMAGHLCVSSERFDDALTYYRRILAVEPWNAEAQQYADRIEQRRPGGMDSAPEHVHQRCQELVAQGHLDQAIAELEALLTAHPNFSLAHNDLGVLYYQRGEKERAVQCYQTAVDLAPDNANFKKNLADFYLVEQGRVEEALKIYMSVLKDNPEDIDILLVAGHVCQLIGQKDSAKTFYHRVLELEPWNFEASERIEKLSD